MTTWTVDAVTASAPDSSSQVAGRKLAHPGPWSEIGVAGGVLWGQCQGSGKTPYRVTVDTETRRYQCSCPSRKFPCKHALGLMYLWAEGAINEHGEVAEFARAFASRRPQESGEEAKAPTESTPAQQAAALARAAKREQRVTDGLAELDRWIIDQVAGGLARSATNPRALFESMAARMIDAQVPGVAAWLRTLPAVVTSGDGWPERLLAELSLVHLLAQGWTQRDTLPEDLLATVREHIGFTIPAADVRTAPAVHDHWAVVALRDLDTEAIPTRRVWLRGQSSGRWAVVLFFAAAGQTMDASLLPGTQIEADLHFYPGRAGFRAVVGERMPEAIELHNWQTGTITVDEAANEWAKAIADDPWQQQIPVVLNGVIDRHDRRWTLTDAEGVAAPLHGVEGDLLKLLAVTAGHPATVFGEWGTAGFRPAAVVRERVVAL